MIKNEVFSSIIHITGQLMSKLEPEHNVILQSLIISLNKLELMENYELDEIIMKMTRIIS